MVFCCIFVDCNTLNSQLSCPPFTWIMNYLIISHFHLFVVFILRSDKTNEEELKTCHPRQLKKILYDCTKVTDTWVIGVVWHKAESGYRGSGGSEWIQVPAPSSPCYRLFPCFGAVVDWRMSDMSAGTRL